MDALLPYLDQPDTPQRPGLGITHLGPLPTLAVLASARTRSAGCSLRLIGGGESDSASGYRPVAASYLAMMSAGTRPRSLMSMPCSLAQVRTAVVSMALAARRPRGARLDVPPTLRAWSMYVRSAVWSSLGVLSVQVDFIVSTVQAEPDGAGSLAAVDVVDVESLHFLSHEIAPFAGWRCPGNSRRSRFTCAVSHAAVRRSSGNAHPMTPSAPSRSGAKYCSSGRDRSATPSPAIPHR